MYIHVVFDIFAWTMAGFVAWLIGNVGWLDPLPKLTPMTAPHYFIVLAFGAISGAVLFGSVNMQLSGMFAFGHSIAGALVGGIAFIEIYKLITGVRGSTGARFVAPLAAGIAIGRLGCFLSGLPDYTYGIETSLPWGVDFGDGVMRHPVQLYESAAMVAFLVIYGVFATRGDAFVLRNGFYLFVLWYGVQRFAWEFLKPYPPLLGPFNLFHFLCAAMVAYAFVMMGRNRELRQAF